MAGMLGGGDGGMSWTWVAAHAGCRHPGGQNRRLPTGERPLPGHRPALQVFPTARPAARHPAAKSLAATARNLPRIPRRSPRRAWIRSSSGRLSIRRPGCRSASTARKGFGKGLLAGAALHGLAITADRDGPLALVNPGVKASSGSGLEGFEGAELEGFGACAVVGSCGSVRVGGPVKRGCGSQVGR